MKTQEDLDSAARELVTCFYLYSGYRVESRGPAGCIMRALEVLHPGAHKMLANGDDAADVIEEFWPDPEDEEETNV